jgi:hypothetical protein
VAVHQPGRPHAGHRRPRRHHPPLGPAHPPAARRRAARPAQPLRLPPSSAPTAPT